jgi:hypothetical protein
MRLPRSKLEIEQLADQDVRSVVIRQDHPEFEQELKEGRREIEGNDGPMSPRVHLKMPEIVETQRWDDSPPEVWDTAARLRDAGYERHEILHNARASGQRADLGSAARRASIRSRASRGRAPSAPRRLAAEAYSQDLGKAPRRRPAVGDRKATAGGDHVAPLAP